MGKGQSLKILKLVFIFFVFFAFTNYIGVACGQNSGNPVSEYPTESCYPTATYTKNFAPSFEEPYCSSVISYSNAVTVTATAAFNVLEQSGIGFGNEILGGPIARAEIQVLDQNNNVIQCSETGPNGEISFLIPKNMAGLKLKINSRADNSFVKASVLNSPSSDNFYSLIVNFNTSNNSTLDLGSIVAPATDSLEGGAFNILDNILKANEALRYFSNSFSVAPKVIVYWQKGVNPYTYVGGSSTVGVSFYVIGSGRLYILGGINGDIDNSDFDHFDNSIINHEYGHFIEDAFSKADSPGGLHDGNHIIDARLAWGEGWANFFSSAIRANKIYSDCYGTQSGSTGCFIYHNMDTNIPTIDVPNAAGEGNFREFAITRALWDSVDPIRNIASGPTSGANPDFNNAQDNLTQPFGNFWDTFSGPFASSSEAFRSVGKFLFMNNDSVLNSSSVFNADKILPNPKDFAQPLPTTGDAACDASAATQIFANDISSYSFNGATICQRGNLHHFCSNQLASNDFYEVNYDGSFSTISISRTSGSAELDMYLYKNPYVFGNQCDIVKQSALGLSSDKSISLSGLAYGKYMLNINVYTGNGNPTSPSGYKIFVDSVRVCP
ncbi:MAG: hypothetical protein IPM57_03305 [Oligoflexia bacterium]|nr:hypothetical protein [Oligoflexia bacterium]